MKKYFMNRYVLSEQGAKDLMYASISHFFSNITLMFPMMIGFTFLRQQFYKLTGVATVKDISVIQFVLFSSIAIAVSFVINKIDYNNCYTKIYYESARSRINLAETLRKLPLSYFGKKDIADLSATIMSDATTVEHMFSHCVPHIYAGIGSVSVITIMLAIFNFKMAIALFWIFPFSFLIFHMARTKQKIIFKRAFANERQIIDGMQDAFDLVQEIKSYNREDQVIKNIHEKLDENKQIKINLELVLGSVLNFSYALLRLGMVSTALFGAYMLSRDSIDVFTYLVFIIISGSIYTPLQDVINNFAELMLIDSIIDRSKEMYGMPMQTGSNTFTPNGYDIEFKNVNFSYEEGVDTIKNISFTAKQGELTALVGPSGGGKSTATKLAARFWDVNSGQITLGGVDISTIEPEVLLKKFSIVFQDVTLFNASIKQNIAIGKDGATDEEILRVAKLTNCDEFVKRLPDGYDTLIGENGEKLSGGERQRISIARALLKDAPIILLDEATASLDAENETLIQQAITELVKNKTVIIIAHRMRTVIGADKIVVIKDGQIVETGNSHELMDKGGIFAQMYKAQMA